MEATTRFNSCFNQRSIPSVKANWKEGIKMPTVLIATTNDELFQAFKVAFQRFDVDLLQVTTYSEAIETLQNGCNDLLITDYFLSAGSQVDDAFEVYNWEVNTIEHDMKIVGLYREALIWLRKKIREKDSEKLFPLGRRLSIEADLLPIRSILLLPYDPFSPEESEDAAIYFSLYRDNLYYCDEELQTLAYKIVGLIIKHHCLNMQRVYWIYTDPAMQGLFLIKNLLSFLVVLKK